MDDASTVFSFDSVSEERCDAEKMALAEQIIGFVEKGQMSVNDISPDMEHCIGRVLTRRGLEREAAEKAWEDMEAELTQMVADADDVSTIPDAYPEADESSTGGDDADDVSTIPDAYPEADESSTGGDDYSALEPEPAPDTESSDEDEGWEYGVPGPDMLLSDIDDAYEGEDDIAHWDNTLGRWVLLETENYTVIGELNEGGEPIYYGDF